ncbi:MAG: hypothetical protein HW421_642 [Ignavibacteria bacterium]|nr:hypothetical protein [Ignavibacteria bacterium]
MSNCCRKMSIKSENVIRKRIEESSPKTVSGFFTSLTNDILLDF